MNKELSCSKNGTNTYDDIFCVNSDHHYIDIYRCHVFYTECVPTQLSRRWRTAPIFRTYFRVKKWPNPEAPIANIDKLESNPLVGVSIKQVIHYQNAEEYGVVRLVDMVWVERRFRAELHLKK